MPRKAVGRQPPQKGPAWDAFVAYWRHAIDGKQSRAIAWRAFHAGWAARSATPADLPAACSLPADLPIILAPAGAANRPAGRSAQRRRDRDIGRGGPAAEPPRARRDAASRW
ncbi:MAG: hypothetical protein AB7U95_23325 [Reyranella sp.]